MIVKNVEKEIETKFDPRTIQITFETEDEIVAFHMIFTHSAIMKAEGIHDVLKGGCLRSKLGVVNYSNKWGAFCDSLTEWFK